MELLSFSSFFLPTSSEGHFTPLNFNNNYSIYILRYLFYFRERHGLPQQPGVQHQGRGQRPEGGTPLRDLPRRRGQLVQMVLPPKFKRGLPERRGRETRGTKGRGGRDGVVVHELVGQRQGYGATGIQVFEDDALDVARSRLKSFSFYI